MYTLGSASWAGNQGAPKHRSEAGSGSLNTRHELKAEDGE